MLVTIKKNDVKKRVTKGAFDNLYASLGFAIIGESKPKDFKEVKEAKIINENLETKEVKENKNK